MKSHVLEYELGWGESVAALNEAISELKSVSSDATDTAVKIEDQILFNSPEIQFHACDVTLPMKSAANACTYSTRSIIISLFQIPRSLTQGHSTSKKLSLHLEMMSHHL